jgi:hypothetical protein
MVSANTADGAQGITSPFLTHLDDTAAFTKADIFLLKPKPVDDAASINNGTAEPANSERLRLVVYGDMLTEEHAKIRLLIMIDQLVCDVFRSQVCASPC